LIASASRLSETNPSRVLVVSTVFGEHDPIWFSAVPRLAPDMTLLGGYFKAGKFRPFNERQIARSQQAGDTVRD
jgi:hypothetical protein